MIDEPADDPAAERAFIRLKTKREAKKRGETPPINGHGNGFDNPIDTKATRQRGKAGELLYVYASDLSDELNEADDLVEDVITRGAMSVIYGDSNSGKTFLAIDIGASVAQGTPWMGKNVEPGIVLYLASESPRSVEERVKVYKRRHGVTLENLVIVKSPVNLFDNQADTQKVIDLVKTIEAKTGKKVELITGDTLARLSAGANENAGQDMGIVVKNIDHIREATGAHFMLIHHTGKDAAKGMRGWSGMRAATDTEIEVVADDTTGERVAEITKQRDLDSKGDRIGFRLETVPTRVSKWGKQRYSCVVVSADAPAKKTKSKRVGEVEGAVAEFLTQRKTGVKKNAVVKHFDGRFPAQSVYRAINTLAEANVVNQAAGMVCIAGAAT